MVYVVYKRLIYEIENCKIIVLFNLSLVVK